ncbi:hypothetical protein BDA96_07G197200 [Sorghum bicolor]|uniref:Uncharacterized protein n=1 Tax=Sorghum bicolor TaxID=4558 RepID=A0A921QL77_SORBI|nr:hypothetical protein BDA96_07G197200 [Sorghum bicolor]
MGCSPTQRQRLLLAASLVVVVLVVITRSAAATRSAPAPGSGCHTTAAVERITVKEAVELAVVARRLRAGPSPRGAGH